MKIIDILVKKANGELESGFKFKHRTETFTYDKNTDTIRDRQDWEIGQFYKLEQLLNDTVEVIEESKEIEEIKFKEGTYVGNKINIITDKLNELVRAVNKMNREREAK